MEKYISNFDGQLGCAERFRDAMQALCDEAGPLMLLLAIADGAVV